MKINFLPVGHTHEDIDQLFSELRQNGCESLPSTRIRISRADITLITLGLLKAIEKSSTPNPKAVLLEGIWDIKGLLGSHVASMANHSKYLNFKFVNSSGKAEMFYRRFSDHPWEPKKKGLNLLSVRIRYH